MNPINNANQTRVDCDECGAHLRGANGNDEYGEDYLSLRATISVYRYLGKPDRFGYNFLTAAGGEDLKFCDTSCLSSFIVKGNRRWESQRRVIEANGEKIAIKKTIFA